MGTPHAVQPGRSEAAQSPATVPDRSASGSRCRLHTLPIRHPNLGPLQLGQSDWRWDQQAETRQSCAKRKSGGVSGLARFDHYLACHSRDLSSKNSNNATPLAKAQFCAASTPRNSPRPEPAPLVQVRRRRKRGGRIMRVALFVVSNYLRKVVILNSYRQPSASGNSGSSNAKMLSDLGN